MEHGVAGWGSVGNATAAASNTILGALELEGAGFACISNFKFHVNKQHRAVCLHETRSDSSSKANKDT
jgi:hypothetical protein